jgi:hypothetical protein
MFGCHHHVRLSPLIMSAEQTTSFSSTGDDVIARTIEIDQGHTRAGDLDDFYEIQRTADEIVAGDYKRVSNFILFFDPQLK